MKRRFSLVVGSLVLPISLIVVLMGTRMTAGILRAAEIIPAASPLAQAQTPTAWSFKPNLPPKIPVEPSVATATPQPIPSLFPEDLSLDIDRQSKRCGGSDPRVFLVVGSDSRDDFYLYGLADFIRLVRIDFQEPHITILSLPRDLWVEIPEIEDHYAITHGKLNQAYLYGGPGMGYYDGPDEGPGLLARTIKTNFDLEVDGYLAINMVTFVKVVDALGGMDLTLPEAIDGRPAGSRGMDEQYFRAGDHHLSGTEALRLARIRTNYDDLVRSEHQNLVLDGLRSGLLSSAVIPAIPEIVDAFSDSVLTDLGISDLAALVCVGSQITEEDVTFVQLPAEVFEAGRVYSPHLKKRVSVFHPDQEAIRGYMAGYQSGVWPENN